MSKVRGAPRDTFDNHGEDEARYQWRHLRTAIHCLQFLPLFYASAPASKISGIAAGLEWHLPLAPTVSEEQTRGSAPQSVPSWFKHLEDDLRSELEQLEVRWPQEVLVAEGVTAGDLEVVVGEAELMFTEAKVAFLLLDVEDQAAAKPHLEQAGWRVCTTVAELATALNEQESGA